MVEEYITDGALVMCKSGSAPLGFFSVPRTFKKICTKPIATTMHNTMINIPTFGVCTKLQKPCTPSLLQWLNTKKDVRLRGDATLTTGSQYICSSGDSVEFLTSGQIPLSDLGQELVEYVQACGKKDVQRSTHELGHQNGWVGWVPLVGVTRDLVYDIMEGDYTGVAMNSIFLVMDVTSLIAPMASGFKWAGKMGAKLIGKQVAKQAAEEGGKWTAKKIVEKGVTMGTKKIKTTTVKKTIRFTKKTIDDMDIVEYIASDEELLIDDLSKWIDDDNGDPRKIPMSILLSGMPSGPVTKAV
jgi:hypothetical protein